MVHSSSSAEQVRSLRPCTNDKFWIFYGGHADIEYELSVTDKQTGESRTCHNPPGEFCGRGDIAALVP